MVKIPNRLEDLYPAQAVEMITDVLQQPGLSGKVREALDRTGLREINPLEQVQQAWQQARSWIESLGLEGSVPQDSLLINATGQLFQSGIDSLAVNSTVARVLANSSIRFLHQRQCEERVARFAKNSFGSKAVAWMRSVEAAIDALVAHRQLLIAKSDLLRIARVGDVSSMLDRLDLVEVGPANGCSDQDWRNALEQARDRAPGKACLLTVSPNMSEKDEAARQRENLLVMSREYQVPAFGLWADVVANEKLAADFGFPLLTDVVSQGLNAIIAPLDLLLGGPCGAIIVGEEGLTDSAMQRAESRGVALGSSEIAANLVALQLSMLSEEIDSGVVSHLLISSANLSERARRMAIQLQDNGVIKKAEAIERSIDFGPVPWSRYSVNSWAVRMQPIEQSAVVHRRLAEGKKRAKSLVSPAILTELEGEFICVDLRFVDPKDDHLIVEALSPCSDSEQGSPMAAAQEASESPEGRE